MVPYHSCGPRASSFVPLHCCLVLQLPHSMRLLGIFFYALPLWWIPKLLLLLLYLAMLVTHGLLIFIIVFGISFNVVVWLLDVTIVSSNTLKMLQCLVVSANSWVFICVLTM